MGNSIGKLTHAGKVAALTELTGGSNTVNIGNMFIGLLTAAPTVASNGTVTVSEVPTTSGGEATGYSRKLIGNYAQASTLKFGAPTYDSTTGKTTITNKEEIHFDSVRKSWGTIYYWALFNESGTVYAYGTLNDADGNALENGDTPEISNIVFFKAGDLVIEIE